MSAPFLVRVFKKKFFSDNNYLDKLNVEKHQAEIKTSTLRDIFNFVYSNSILATAEGRVNNAIKLFKGFA